MDKLYMIIPAYNEEENIKSVAEEWHEIVGKIENESLLVIIDDGSKDSTYTILKELEKELTHLKAIKKQNSGHGATLLYGYNYCLENNADYIFQTDSDGQTLPSEFWRFWSQRKDYDAVIGYRKGRQDGFSRKVVTKTLKFILWCVFYLDITDANTPFRLMSKDVLKKHIKKVPKNFNLSNVMLTVSMLKEKESVKFIPITFRPRQGGVNSINLNKISKIGIQAVKDFYKIKKISS